MTDARIVVPFQGEDPDRIRALRYVRHSLPWPTSIGQLNSDEPWCKAEAVRLGIGAVSDCEVLVVHDADVECIGLGEAILKVAAGAPWAIPHRDVYRLTREQTDDHIMSGGMVEAKRPYDRPPYRGFAGGGIVVLRRELYGACPLDPRFLGWSGEDESWAKALTCLYGKPWRGTAPLVHLWHPPQERLTTRWGSQEARALAGRYTGACRSRGRMRELLAEIPPIRTTV